MPRKKGKKKKTKVLKPIKQPNALAKQYASALQRLSRRHRTSINSFLRRAFKGDTPISRSQADQFIRGLSSKVKVSPKVAKAFAEGFQRKIDRWNIRQVRKQIGIKIPELSNGVAKSFIELNAKLIKSVGSEHIEDVKRELLDAAKVGRHPSVVAKRIAEAGNVSEGRAKSIAVDQALTLNSNLTTERHKAAGITEYHWDTTQSSKVRPWHRALHGRKFSYKNPPMGGGTSASDKGSPGSGIHCMCVALPIIELFEGL
jgi:SPP1 gp7 family putative phage head morphogenesis protein